MNGYPQSAGWTEPTASREAAEKIERTGRAARLRESVQVVLQRNPAGLSADEIALRCGESVLAVRPRVAELHRDHIIIKTGERRTNQSGMSANVWKLA